MRLYGTLGDGRKNMIEVKDLSYSYDDDHLKLALKDVTLNIPKGQFVAV